MEPTPRGAKAEREPGGTEREPGGTEREPRATTRPRGPPVP
jgi:hypothetical protein